MFLAICETSASLSTILVAKRVIEIIGVVVPIILIIMCAVDLLKQVINPDMKDYSKLTKRIFAASCIFFIPTIVSLLLDLVGTTDFSATRCWTDANASTIEFLSKQEKAEKEAEEKAKADENAEAKRKREEQARIREEIRKENEEEAQQAGQNGKDGLVIVKDDVFYYPCDNSKNGTAASKGSAPYGYVKPFYDKLVAFTKAAQAAGVRLQMSTTDCYEGITGVCGAWRSRSSQDYAWHCYKTKSCNNGNLAAYPGTSRHGWGIASDMSSSNWSWAHAHAKEYGLTFPIPSEDWHVEPLNIKCY